MKNTLDDHRPIFQQIKEQIEDSILNHTYAEGEKVPSTNDFARFYKINPATAAKGVNELVDEGILYKRRGVGMFVTENARSILIENRKEKFYENFMLPLKHEAEKLQISVPELLEMVKREEGNDEN